MRITVRATGTTLADLTGDTIRDLRAANKTAARQVARKGRAAMVKGAPVMLGRRLAIKTKTEAWPSRWSVEFFPAPRTAGLWSIAETGAAPHEIEPRTRRALHFAGVFAANVDHPGAAGRKAYTKAGKRLADVTDTELTDVYDDALGD